MHKVLLAFGTRPEAIKLAPVAKNLELFGIYAGSPWKRIKARGQGLLELGKQYLAYSG